MDSVWFTLGVPFGALLFAVTGYVVLRVLSHRIDKDHAQPGE